MDSEMLKNLETAADNFAAKWSGMFRRCANCGNEVPAAEVRQQFAVEAKDILGKIVVALHSNAAIPANDAERAAAGEIDAEFEPLTPAEIAERDAAATAEIEKMTPAEIESLTAAGVVNVGVDATNAANVHVIDGSNTGPATVGAAAVADPPIVPEAEAGDTGEQVRTGG